MPEIVNMPKLGFDMAEGTLVRWSKQEGENVDKGEVLAEIETDKATVEVESAYSGLVYRHLVEENSIVPVGTPIAVISAPDEKVDVSKLPLADSQPSSSEHQAQGKDNQKPVEQSTTEKTEDELLMLKASPLAKRMARDHQLDLSTVTGTGPGGRVVKRDVEAALEGGTGHSISEAVDVKSSETSADMNTSLLPLPLMLSGEIPEDKKIPVNKLRGIIGQRMVQAKQQVPHFYVTHDVNVSPLMALYKEINGYLPQEQKISINDFVVKAAALSLRKFANLNASIIEGNIIQYGHINIGVAVAIEGGLLTVVSKDADQKPLRLISAEIKSMVQRARAGKIKTDDIEGSTFSISNLGMYDVEEFVAIINPPEAAILAVGSAQKVPVIEGDEIKPGYRMKITLSADHRVTDGAEAAQFLQHLAQNLEEPTRLLL